MTRGGKPNCFEALVSCGAEAACFDAAFFRYLEHNAAADEDGPMIIRSWPEGDFERKLVVLWSGAAVSEFARLWRRGAPGDHRDRVGDVQALPPYNSSATGPAPGR